MPRVKEFRIVLPMSVKEYEIGRHWQKIQKLNLDLQMVDEDSIGRIPEKIIVDENIDSMPFICGKVINDLHVEHCVVKKSGFGELNIFNGASGLCESLLIKAVGGHSMQFETESWDGYPYFHSVTRTNADGKCYEAIIDSVCLPGNEQLHNALALPESMLKDREVIVVDIANHVTVSSGDYQDPTLFHSEKTGRGPLEPGWMESAKPVLTCYVLVTANFDQSTEPASLAEDPSGIIQTMTLQHSEMFCAIDDWIDKTLDDFQDMEKQMKIKLKEIPEEVLNQPSNVPAYSNNQESRGEEEEEAPRNFCSLFFLQTGFSLAMIAGIGVLVYWLDG